MENTNPVEFSIFEIFPSIYRHKYEDILIPLLIEGKISNIENSNGFVFLMFKNGGMQEIK